MKTMFYRGASLMLAIMLAATLVVPGTAQAQSTSITAQIQALLAQIAALQAQVQALQGGSSSCYVFTRDLTIRSTGTDVTALQNYLKSTGHFSASVASTGYFGPITAQAVASWQAASGVSPASGYFGPISRAKYNSRCVIVPPPPSNDDDDDDDALSGEADLSNFEALSTPSNEDVEEGDEDVEVFGFEFDVDDADVRVERVAIRVEASGTINEDEPWRHFEEFALMVGNDVIAREDAGDEDNWSEIGSDVYELRFTGLNEIFDEGETAEMIVLATAQENIDGDELPQDWDIYVPDEGLRARDGENIQHEIGDENESVTMTVEEAGEGEELRVSIAADDPDETVFEIEENDSSEETTIMIFDLEARNGDMSIDSIPVTVTIGGSSATYNDVIAEIFLQVGSQQFSDDSVSGANTQTAVVTFDIDGDLEINEDEEESVELVVRFKQQDGNYDEGTTIRGSLTSTNVDAIDAEGADDLEAGQLEGSAVGSTHTLRIGGVAVDGPEFDFEIDENASGDATDDEGIFTIEFEVTAFGDDFYVPFDASRNTSTGTGDGVRFDILNSSNGVVSNGSASAALSTTAETDDDAYVVREGNTETFTLTVAFDPATSGFYKVQLDTIRFRGVGESDASATSHEALPEASFRTPAHNI